MAVLVVMFAGKRTRWPPRGVVVYVDGKRRGFATAKNPFKMAIPNGQHKLHCRIAWLLSPEVRIVARASGNYRFMAHVGVDQGLGIRIIRTLILPWRALGLIYVDDKGSCRI